MRAEPGALRTAQAVADAAASAPRRSLPRLIAALVIGCPVAIAIGAGAFSLLRALWPEYAAAEPTKAYTLAMLFTRLGVGIACTVGAAAVATLVARDGGRAAWWLGGLFVLVSLPSHLHYSWAHYPLWYHVVYLSYLVPIAAWTGRVVLVATQRRH